jgi:hypothetical protein
MINNKTRKDEIVKSWNALRKIQNSLTRVYLAPGCGFINEKAPDTAYNLPFVLAFSVLDEVLSELSAQKTIRCKSRKLGAKMEASINILPWKNYGLVDDGRDKRNDLAHKAIVISKAECLKFIDAIENELKEWGIL